MNASPRPTRPSRAFGRPGALLFDLQSLVPKEAVDDRLQARRLPSPGRPRPPGAGLTPRPRRGPTMPAMRFLDAELRPVPFSRALSPLLTAAAITVMGVLFGLASGHGAGAMAALFPAVLVGALMAEAGISPQRSPRAMFASLPLVGLLLFGSAKLAALLGLTS